jgi:hypothetical protein
MGARGPKSQLDEHPQKRQILRDLANPLNKSKEMAAKYGVHLRTIENWKSRIKPLMSLARHNSAQSTSDDLMQDMMEIYQDGRDLIMLAKEEKDIKGGAAVMQAMLGTVKLKGEATGVLRPEGKGEAKAGSGVNIQMLIGMPRGKGPLREGEGELADVEVIDIPLDDEDEYGQG